MKLLEIWGRIGKQPLRITRRKDAIVFVGDSEYKIKSIRYNRGQFIGFEAEPKAKVEWISKEIKPKQDTWIIVRDKNGEEYRDHQWTGHAWYHFSIGKDSCDGWRSDVDIVSWQYQEIDYMAKYKRKSKEIEAFQYDGDFMNSSGEYYVPEWAVEALKNGILYYDSQNKNEPPSTLFISHPNGFVLDIKVGYYIIRQSDGIISACTESYLNDQYEIIE